MPTMRRRTLLESAFAAPLASIAGGGSAAPLQAAAQFEIGSLNILGAYGSWAANGLQDPPRHSFRRPEFTNVAAWRSAARAQFRERLLQPPAAPASAATIVERLEYDGLAIERVQWQLNYGPPSEALFLKPAGATGKLPGVLALHCHGGQKFFGYRKITRTSRALHPVIQKVQDELYGGLAWANELAKRGYAVLAPDAYAFGSRRLRVADVPPGIRGAGFDPNPDSEAEIQRYNTFAGNHEQLMAKSLFCAGLTWPGVFVNDDQRALDYLASRPEVDAARLGCGGLSGGGLRTVMLTGADERIRCSCCVGMMTTWRDYLLNKSSSHTWMVYTPGLPRDLDYPEILGLAAPNPVMVLNNRQDALFTLSEMQRADTILTEVYRKAGVGDRYRCGFYDGPHKFDRDMQRDAFAWFDRWLKA